VSVGGRARVGSSDDEETLERWACRPNAFDHRRDVERVIVKTLEGRRGCHPLVDRSMPRSSG